MLADEPTDPNTLKIEEIRQNIYDLHMKIEKLGDPPAPIVGLVDSTNILRTNEYLGRADNLKTDLILSYENYSELLESLAKSVIDIQAGLLEILREQSAMMEKKGTMVKSGSKTPKQRAVTKPESKKSKSPRAGSKTPKSTMAVSRAGAKMDANARP